MKSQEHTVMLKLTMSEINTINQITVMLNAYANGEDSALDSLIGALYQELCQAAEVQLNKAGHNATFDSHDLVHEVYLKLKKSAHFSAQNRSHFLALSATAMRQVILDRIKDQKHQKRGGHLFATTLGDHKARIEDTFQEIMMINNSLAELREIDPKLADTVECRYFAGYDEQQTAEALNVSPRTIRRYWVTAKKYFTEKNRLNCYSSNSCLYLSLKCAMVSSRSPSWFSSFIKMANSSAANTGASSL